MYRGRGFEAQGNCGVKELLISKLYIEHTNDLFWFPLFNSPVGMLYIGESLLTSLFTFLLISMRLT